MPLFALVAFAPFFLKGHDLDAALVPQHNGGHLGAVHVRLAQRQRGAIRYGQHRKGINLVTFLDLQAFDGQDLACFHAVLFTARLNNRVSFHRISC